MKNPVNSVLIFSLIVFTLMCCENENVNNPDNNDPLVLSGKLINNSACKYEFKGTSEAADVPDTLSCIQYTFNKDNNTLTLKHINAGFNCCFDSLYIHTSRNGDTIVIQEFEANALCHCNCLYDLDIELTGVEAKQYSIRLIEPYAEGQQEIVFEADLNNFAEGEFCVTRKQYPWGVVDGTHSELTGKLSGQSECKSSGKSAAEGTDTSDTLSCVEYSYSNETNVLNLKHVNAGFNCCPDSLYVQVSLEGDTIFIQEYEKSAFCDCNCLYDLEIELTGVEPKRYQICFVEPYAVDYRQLSFEVDFYNIAEGDFCVTRKYYPWGIEGIDK